MGDLTRLPSGLGLFDLVVASNVFEHLDDPAQKLKTVLDSLDRGGEFLMVVPPIIDQASLLDNRRNPFHRSNLFVGEWLALLTARFGSVRTFRHLLGVGGELDFSNPFPSRFSAADFVFLEIPAESLGTLPTLGAVYFCGGATKEVD